MAHLAVTECVHKDVHVAADRLGDLGAQHECCSSCVVVPAQGSENGGLSVRRDDGLLPAPERLGGKWDPVGEGGNWAFAPRSSSIPWPCRIAPWPIRGRSPPRLSFPADVSRDESHGGRGLDFLFVRRTQRR